MSRMEVCNRASLWHGRLTNAIVWILLCSGLLSGCGLPGVPTSYGSLDYPEKINSVNGMGVVEKLCGQSGLRVMNVSRLSPRLKRVDSLILVGHGFAPPAKEARDWIEQWLSEKSGRTVFYFGRDFVAETYIFRKTLAQQPPEKKTRAQFDMARAQSSLDRDLYSNLSDDIFCRWFMLRSSQPAQTITQFDGPLSDLMGDGASWPVRAFLDTVDPDLQGSPPTWRTPTMTPAFPFSNPRLRPKSASQDKPSVFTSYWSATDINDDETWNSEWDKVSQANVLLSSSDGTPLVTELTNERFEGSRIVLLANGAPLLNGMLVEPHFMRLASHLVGQLPAGSRVAFLPFDSGIQVSQVPDDEDQIAGLSVLVTWPLNILMAHLALLGVLICLALFPIRGRPQRLPENSTSDFGQHAEALGLMLSRTRDIHFAAQLSADYLRLVRGESLPNWLQSATTPPAPAALPAQATQPTPTHLQTTQTQTPPGVPPAPTRKP